MMFDDLSDSERRAAVRLALGRIFRLGSRPTQPGDVAVYEMCRAVILSCTNEPTMDYRPNWARDRRAGAAGD